MNKETLKRMKDVITSRIHHRTGRFTQLCEKMNQDYDRFFRHDSVELFIVNLELKHLKKLQEELAEDRLDEIEEIIDANEHFYLQKLVSAPVTASTNIPMENLAYTHERTVYQFMYSIMGILKNIMGYEK